MRSHAPRVLAAAFVLAASAFPAARLAAQEALPGWSAARYEGALFDDGTDAWHSVSLEAGVRRPRLTPIARVNRAWRFGADAVQVEADLYPAWPGVGYAYLSGAWAEGAPFPELRMAAEVFASLPDAFEASAGIVYLDFGTDEAAILVGSISKYSGNYWLSLRPSWTTGPGDVAVTLIARRYLRSAGDFVTLRLLAGSTPDEIATRGVTGGADLGTLGVHADAQLELSRRWLLLPVAGVVSEETGADRRRLRTTLGIGAALRF